MEAEEQLDGRWLVGGLVLIPLRMMKFIGLVSAPVHSIHTTSYTTIHLITPTKLDEDPLRLISAGTLELVLEAATEEPPTMYKVMQAMQGKELPADELSKEVDRAPLLVRFIFPLCFVWVSPHFSSF